MNVNSITPLQLSFSFLPLLLLGGVFLNWHLNWKELLLATFRMLVQLIGIGYLLTFIFNQKNPLWTVGVVTVMLLISGWISLRSVKAKRQELYGKVFLCLLFGSTPVLIWMTAVVIPGKTWYDPTFLIPLAGMVYANTMNTIALAVERFFSELETQTYVQARKKAFTASLIPHINTFLAVGLVNLPGMMTGQILSGVDPLIAVRYQVVVMNMIIASAGLSTAMLLWSLKQK